MSSINSYSVAAGGICIVNMIVVVFLLYVAVQIFINFWLSYWIDDGSGVSIRIIYGKGRQLFESSSLFQRLHSTYYKYINLEIALHNLIVDKVVGPLIVQNVEIFFYYFHQIIMSLFLI